jgi:hypothetical protein
VLRFAAPLALLALLALALAPRAAEAATCCGDPGALGGRVADGEVAVATVAVEARERLGAHGDDGAFQSMNPGDFERSIATTLGWAARVYGALEVGIAVPVLARGKALGDRAELAAGLGDVTARARATVLRADATSLVPALFVSLAGVIPTGTPSALATSALGVDVFGQGVPEARLGLELEEYLDGAWLVALAGSAGVFGASDAGGLRVERAPRLAIAATVGPRLDTVGLGLGVDYQREAAPAIDGLARGAGRAQTALVAAAFVELSTTLAVTGQARLELPLDGAGRNETTSLALGAGLRWAALDE